MSNLFDGYVLQGARSSQTNSPTTSLGECGVSRSVQPLPVGYPTGQPGVVEARADQYQSNDEGEYLVWAANTASMATLEDPT